MATQRSTIADTLPSKSTKKTTKKTTRKATSRTQKPATVKSTLANNEEPKRDRRTTIYLTEEMWKEMKRKTIETGDNVSVYVEKLIAKDLKNNTTK